VAMFLAFCGAAMVLAMIPGPSTAVIVRQALRGGRRAAFATLAANELGVLFWGAVASFGASALVEASQVAYGVVRWAGAAILVVLGIQSLVGRGPTRTAGIEPADPVGGGVGRQGDWRSFRVGLLTILANPKAAVFAASFLPQFVPPHAKVLPAMLALAVVWVVVDSSWYVALILLVGRLQDIVSRDRVRTTLERASGTILVALGLRLALERR